jgi:hypothetical protein
MTRIAVWGIALVIMLSLVACTPDKECIKSHQEQYDLLIFVNDQPVIIPQVRTVCDD